MKDLTSTPKTPKALPTPDVVPEAPPPGQAGDKTAGLKPIHKDETTKGGERQRAEAERAQR